MARRDDDEFKTSEDEEGEEDIGGEKDPSIDELADEEDALDFEPEEE